MRTFIKKLKGRAAPLDSPYLRALREGALSREGFIASQMQFLHAVVHFSRPLAALVGRVHDAGTRRMLLDNIRDELGGGDPSQSHERTFYELLARLGVAAEEVPRYPAEAPVLAFNAALDGVCGTGDPLVALAMLGMIEDLFAGISVDLGRSIEARGWLPSERIIHYPIHAELDLAHAEGFYRHLEGPFATSPQQARAIERGLELGAHVFLRLYEDLYRAVR